MKILLTVLLLTLSFTASAVDNNLNFQLQQQYQQRQIIMEMQNMRRLQENALWQQRQEYNRDILKQNNNQILRIISQPRPAQSYAITPVDPLTEQILFGQ